MGGKRIGDKPNAMPDAHTEGSMRCNCGTEPRKYNDVLHAQYYDPLFPGSGINFALNDVGRLTDNYGNYVQGHDLYIKKNTDKYTHYHLNEAQFKDLYEEQIRPDVNAVSAFLHWGDEIPVLFHMRSPLAELGDKLGNGRQNDFHCPNKSKSR